MAQGEIFFQSLCSNNKKGLNNFVSRSRTQVTAGNDDPPGTLFTQFNTGIDDLIELEALRPLRSKRISQSNMGMTCFCHNQEVRSPDSLLIGIINNIRSIPQELTACQSQTLYCCEREQDLTQTTRNKKMNRENRTNDIT